MNNLITATGEEYRHEHVFLGADHDRNARRTLWVVILTAAMMVAEIVAGIAYNSMALLADGFHMATHAVALGVAAAAYAYAKRHARNPRYSFGTGKVGDLAGFSSALILAVIALGIVGESVQRLIAPHPVAYFEATIIAVIGLVVNMLSAILLGHGHNHGHDDHAHEHAHHHHDNNLRSAYLHVLADTLTSVLAIAALLGGRYLGWAWLDPAMGVVGALVIAVWSRNLLRDTAVVLLDTTDTHLMAEVRELVEATGETKIDDLHIWRVGPGAHAAIVATTGKATAAEIRERLASVHEIAHLTVEARLV